MEREQLATLIEAIEAGDLDAVECWTSKIDKSDYPVFIEKYHRTHSWEQKDAIAFLLSYQNEPSLEPLFLDYMQKVPSDFRGETQIFTLAIMLRYFGEEYDQVGRYLSSYDRLFADVDKVLAGFGLERSPEERNIAPKQKETPLTDIPLDVQLDDTVEPEQQLLVAIERGDIALLERAIATGADTNIRIQHPPLTGCTPLMAALYLKQSDVAFCLIEAGGDVSIRRSNREGVSPELGQTALGWAASRSPVSVVEALLAAGAPVDSSDGASTPLANAVDYGRIDIVECLLAAGANLQHPHYQKSPLLHRAVKYDELEMAQYLIDEVGVDIEAYHEYGNTALHTAVGEGFMDHVKMLLSHGANPNATYAACKSGKIPERVVAKTTGMTPLAIAIRDNRLNMAKELIKRGANPNQSVVRVDGSTHPPLSFATKRKEAFAALLAD
ncbi:MAG: ankyrin repeat domain-containing protein [Cyanobacteria bacterium P01_D01_bin.1]